MKVVRRSGDSRGDGFILRKTKLFCCCRQFQNRFEITKDLLKIYFAVFNALFASAFSITMLFPFLPFMVEFLLPQIDVSSVGKYAGMIASAMFLGRFFGSYFWGVLSDIWGRKPVLIISELLVGIATLAFGFSINFPMAIATRFAVGITNGIIVNIKAVLSETSTHKNQAIGYSVLSSAIGAGIVFGPAISGAIADPVRQYNLNITNVALNNFLMKFPYSPPCIVNFLFCLIGAISVIFLLPETLGRKKQPTTTRETESIQSESSGNETHTHSSDQEEDVEDSNRHEIGQSNETQTHSFNQEDIVEHNEEEETDQHNSDQEVSSDQLIQSEIKDEEEKELPVERKTSFVLSLIQGRRNTATLQYVKLQRRRYMLSERKNNRRKWKQERSSNELEEQEETSSNQDLILSDEDDDVKIKSFSKSWFYRKKRNLKSSVFKSLKNLKMLLKDPITRLSLITYCTFSFVVIGFDEVYPLWCATPDYLGGLDFSLNQIGISLSIVGGILLPFSLFLFPLLEKCFGSIVTFQILIFSQMFCIVLLPNLHFLVPLNQPVVLWILLCLSMCVIRIAISIGFAATALFINNSVTFDKLGSVNGLAMTMTSAFRIVSPIFAGSVYSASLSKTTRSLGFPVNYHMIFIIFGFILFIVVIMTSLLPKSINNQKVVEEETHL